MAGDVEALWQRFEAKVDRTGEHHLWTGARKRDGTGLLKVAGRMATAPRTAWELAHGPLPAGAEVGGCRESRSCGRVEHLTLRGVEPAKPERGPRAGHGRGSKGQIQPGVWKLTVSAGHYDDGRRRRLHRTVHAETEAAADRELTAFAAEVQATPQLGRRDERDMTLDQAVERYLEEHLREERGREERTIRGYRQVHRRWFAPELGSRRLRDIDEAAVEQIFGRMRRTGLSRSRMNHAKSLYQPLFRWAKRRRIISGSPMADFELPASTQVGRSRVPPEVDQLCRYLAAAVEVVPEVAPLLTLGAVSGMRRGELVAVRRDRLLADRGELLVDSASDVVGLKTTKTRVERVVSLDPSSVEMLLRHCEEMDERAAACGAEVTADGFVFSLVPDCSEPMPADYVTKRVAVLKQHLGIEDKRPETVALEDEALRLFRLVPEPRPAGRRGPAPKGGLSYDEIGKRLGRSSRWAAMAIAAAERRELAAAKGDGEVFDGSILALRKFTSSELLDAGFNISAVAQRQGHGPQVLTKHYAKGRRSADRKAAEHLGRLVHRRDDDSLGL